MSTTALKIVALVLMLIDHIGEFIPGAPFVFRIIGRLSAPLFIFCSMWGFHYTRNRKKYLLRLYGFSLGMGIINVILNSLFISPYKYCSNNIFSSIFLICLFLYCIENCRNKGVAITAFAFLNGCGAMCAYLPQLFKIGNFYNFVIALIPSVFTCEGELMVFVMGLAIYYTKNDKKHLTDGYGTFCIFYFLCAILTNISATGGHVLPMHLWLFRYCIQWMQAGALPLMLCYNGKPGIGLKYLFYIFYPLHIALLYIIGNII